MHKTRRKTESRVDVALGEGGKRRGRGWCGEKFVIKSREHVL